MKYITKVGTTHIIECNNINHQIYELTTKEGKPEVEVIRFQYNSIKINKDLTISTLGYGVDTHLAEIVLAVELVRFILQNTNK